MASHRAALPLFILLLVLAIAAYWWWFARHPQPEPLPLIHPGGLLADKALTDESDQLLQQAEAILATEPNAPAVSRPNREANPISVSTQAGSNTSPWQLAESEKGQGLPVPESIAIYEPVTLSEQVALPQPGDQLQLPLPDGDSVQVTVSRSSHLENGDYSWSGYVDGEGNNYPVVMTYGAGLAFATITTPRGAYSLEARNGSGWVYKNPAEVELTQPGKNDYLEVPEEELRQHLLHHHH